MAAPRSSFATLVNHLIDAHDQFDRLTLVAFLYADDCTYGIAGHFHTFPLSFDDTSFHFDASCCLRGHDFHT